jgi:predicted naringenin-chalcone synthase
MSYLSGIGTAMPVYKHSQQNIADFYCATLNGNDPEGSIARSIRVLARKSGITSRYSVIPDFSDERGSQTLFEKGHRTQLPSLSERMKVYGEQALSLATGATAQIPGFEDSRQSVTHVIAVTCTGLSAPGLELGLIQQLGLSDSTKRYAVNFMGCNAAILALRQAHDICRAEPEAVVLIVCVEICSIHFQHRYNEDYLLSNLLFGDGAAAVIVYGDSAAPKETQKFRISDFKSLIVPEGKSDMGWNLSESGFIMTLSPAVSAHLVNGVRRLFSINGIQKSDFQHWAIHPGGKRILDDLCRGMELSREMLAASYEVLDTCGNLSSSTVLFVLEKVLNGNIRPGEKIFTAAFGPGLTIETAILEHV